jgi:hypothetical protein
MKSTIMQNLGIVVISFVVETTLRIFPFIFIRYFFFNVTAFRLQCVLVLAFPYFTFKVHIITVVQVFINV